ncbi:MAG: histidine--tRNA ligase, partial [Flavobacteriia bacterium]|nr:histidine--tRNA ligase [Flavobacteriia bacterium]
MLPKGTRDILPGPMRVRTHIMRIVESVFQRYAFVRIETPAIELNSSLTGKYGEEGDRLMFKVLPRGEKLKKFEGKAASEMQAGVEEALRYDLTVPFARFVVDHRNDLAFPFKRYQIQNVWRGDRPQKGRYREFTQCDADVVGISGIVQEAEMMHIYNDVFCSLELPAQLAINHRKL